MEVSTEAGLALLQGGALLALSAMIRGYCARHLDLELVPAILHRRVRLANRMMPPILLIGGALMASGALLVALPN
jgi:hypothetical protein